MSDLLVAGCLLLLAVNLYLVVVHFEQQDRITVLEDELAEARGEAQRLRDRPLHHKLDRVEPGCHRHVI